MNIIISNTSGKPIYEQITSQIKNMIVSGELKAEDPLPSMRLLAKELRISLITTKRAYEDLEREGFIVTVVGKGSFVAGASLEIVKEEKLRIIEENNDFVFRKDFKNFITNMFYMNIPVFITSAGLLEPISDALQKNDCNLPNVSIVANEIKEVNGEIIGTKKPMIHSYNKDKLNIPVSNYELGLLFGDLPGDLLMGKGKNTINIGFVNEGKVEEYNKVFDITLTDNSSFDNVGKLLIKQYKKN